MFYKTEGDESKMIQFHTDKADNIEAYKELGTIIRAIIGEKKVGILKNTEAFSKALLEKNVDEVVVMQLSLLLEAGNIRNYLTQVKSGISMIDVNNMITCAEDETGLTKKKIKLLLTAVLYGLSLPSAIENVIIPQGNGEFGRADSAIISAEEYSASLEEVKQAIKNKNEGKLKELSTSFERLVKAGVPEAMYLKGMCYKEGIGTEVDVKHSLKYLMAAADAGHAEANAVMGDYYFDSPTYDFTDYTKAFNYYTQIGAVALSDDRKDNLRAIMASNKQNIIQLILTGVLLAILFVFNQQLGMGTFSTDMKTHWGWAITSDVLSTVVYGLSIFVYTQAKYNKTKWAATTMFIITAITTFFALI